MCTPGGAAAPAKGLGSIEEGSQSPVREKFAASGVHCLFLLSFACNAFAR